MIHLVELTLTTSAKPIAIELNQIGEVRDVSTGIANGRGKTMITHAQTRRVKWELQEDYAETMRRIREAQAEAVNIQARGAGG